MVAIIDAEDWPRVSQYKWYITYRTPTKNIFCSVRATTKVDGYNIKLHRFILNVKLGQMVDHIDGNPLNNRRNNIRICTCSENGMNRKKNVGTRYKGIKKLTGKRKKYFGARIQKQGTHYFLGCFATEKEAAKAYDEKAIQLFGKFARLNFPEKETICQV